MSRPVLPDGGSVSGGGGGGGGSGGARKASSAAKQSEGGTGAVGTGAMGGGGGGSNLSSGMQTPQKRPSITTADRTKFHQVFLSMLKTSQTQVTYTSPHNLQFPRQPKFMFLSVGSYENG